jgi:DNA-binding transcriptional LysR family regulator
MNLLQLKYFQTVAKLENMTRAAEELHIAQPSLSKTIARLEEDLGVYLFERRGRQIRINKFGKTFLARVQRVFSELEDGRRELADMSGLESGSVTVGATISRLLPKLFSEFLTEKPYVKFRLVQVTRQLEIQRQLVSGELDLCISILPVEQPEVSCIPLTTEEIYLVVPPGHRLAKNRSALLKEIAGEPFIHHTTESGLRMITDSFFQQAEFVPDIAFECTTPEVICSLVKEGLGNALIPASWWNTANMEPLPKLHIENPACDRTIWLSWIKKHYMSEAAVSFKQFTVEYFKKTNI